MGVYDEIPLEDLPWCAPLKSIDGRSFCVPSLNKLVTVVFTNENIYSPMYIDSENYNYNLMGRLEEMGDDDYVNFSALLFDNRTMVYSDNNEFRIDYKYNSLTIDDGSINLILKNNDQIINLGIGSESQQVIFGNHWLEWFDKFVKELLYNKTSLIDSRGGNVTKPFLDKILKEYIDKRVGETKPDYSKSDKFLSENVYLPYNKTIQRPTNFSGLIPDGTQHSPTREDIKNDNDLLFTVSSTSGSIGNGSLNTNTSRKPRIKENSPNFNISEYNGEEYVSEKDKVRTKVDDVSTNCDELNQISDEQLTSKYQLSKYYTLEDAISNGSRTRKLLKLKPNETWSGLSKKQIICNLKNLFVNIIDPITEKYPKIRVTSSLRGEGAGSSFGCSQHNFGMACDFQIRGMKNSQYSEVINWAKQNVSGYDQLLREMKENSRGGSGRVWIHVSFVSKPYECNGKKYGGNRKQDLTLINDGRNSGGKTIIGFPDIFGQGGYPDLA